MMDKISVRNVETGEVGEIRRKLFNSPVINPGILVEVDEGPKPDCCGSASVPTPLDVHPLDDPSNEADASDTEEDD